MQRECALEVLIHKFPQNSIIVSTTGKTSREIFEIARKSAETRDFVTFELVASIDQFGVKLPKRQFLPDEFPGIGEFFN